MSDKCRQFNQRKIATAAQLDRGFFNKIIHGKLPCPKKVAIRLESVTGIPAADWIFAEPAALRERLAAIYAKKEAA